MSPLILGTPLVDPLCIESISPGLEVRLIVEVAVEPTLRMLDIKSRVEKQKTRN